MFKALENGLITVDTLDNNCISTIVIKIKLSYTKKKTKHNQYNNPQFAQRNYFPPVQSWLYSDKVFQVTETVNWLVWSVSSCLKWTYRKHTDVFGFGCEGSAQLHYKLLRIQTNFDDIIEQSKERSQREGGHKESHHAKLNNWRGEKQSKKIVLELKKCFIHDCTKGLSWANHILNVH